MNTLNEKNATSGTVKTAEQTQKWVPNNSASSTIKTENMSDAKPASQEGTTPKQAVKEPSTNSTANTPQHTAKSNDEKMNQKEKQA